MKTFDNIMFDQIPIVLNKQSNAMATFGSLLDMPNNVPRNVLGRIAYDPYFQHSQV